MSKLIRSNKEQDSNTIKVGMFQLQTKSFWLGLVAILVLFMFSVIYLNTYFWYKVCNDILTTQEKIMNVQK